MFPSAEEQSDEPYAHPGNNAAGEHSRAFGFPLRSRLPRQLQNAHAGVVVVRHFALRGLPNELVIRRPEPLGRPLGQFPLRRRRQRDSQVRLQTLESLERHAAAVTEGGDHGRYRLVILLRARRWRDIRREHLVAAVTAQALHLVTGGFQRGPPHDPHQRFGLLLAVDFSRAALRAGVSMLECGMGDRYRVRAWKLCRSVAPMSLLRGLRALRRPFLRSGPGATFRLYYSSGFLRAAPAWRRLFGQGVQCRLELLPVGLAQRREHAAFDDLVQFRQVHVDPFA